MLANNGNLYVKCGNRIVGGSAIGKRETCRPAGERTVNVNCKQESWRSKILAVLNRNSNLSLRRKFLRQYLFYPDTDPFNVAGALPGNPTQTL